MFVKADHATQVEMAPGVLRRTLGHGEKMLHAQVGYMVQGRMQLTVGDQTQTVEGGDSYYIPGDIPHGAVMLEDSVVVDVFCPPREDYL
jgi:quercetin dioxygenase-like cupin family protein